MKFVTLDDILTEMEAIYHDARTGRMDWTQAQCAATILLRNSP